MTAPDTATRITDALQRGVANLKQRGDNVNEATTRSVLVDSVLDALGYPPPNRSPEESTFDNRPDYLCYVGAVSPQSGYPSLVVEAKRLDANFDRVPSGQARATSPDRQIQRYLRSDNISGPHTIGALTDGVRWRVYRRGSAATDVEHITSFNFSSISDSPQTSLGTQPAGLDEFIDLLSSSAIAAKLYPDARRDVNLADRLFETVQTADGPAQILMDILAEPNAIISNSLENADSLTGVRKDAHDTDWETYAVAQGPILKTDTPDLEGSRIPVAAVKLRFEDGQKMSRGDVALCARTVASSTHTNTSAVFVYDTAPNGSVTARMAVAAAGQVNMTAQFDPALPSPSARTSINQQLRLIRDTSAPLNAERLLSPLAVSTLRQQFYREVAEWAARAQLGKDRVGREAVLRHLIRVMFAWILKEEDRIPPEIFEPAFIDGSLSNANVYHRDVLQFLFHSRLNVRYDERDPHPTAEINEALERAPFLNGSLFAKQNSDDDLDLEATDYWSVDEEYPGLFTILSRYHWTMDEHRPGESEQTLDPELLSNLFERLIASTEKGGDESPLRQPQGTYYTPADVVDEMVKDALSTATKGHAPGLSDTHLLDLFGNNDASLPDMAQDTKMRLAGRIRELLIFDPAVGSGAFLFSMLLAIHRSLKKLEGIDEPAEEIIRRQLRGQDINPLAVQIARLRLFIAIAASRKALLGALSEEDEVLPNLEAVIVCADTLETVADPEWRSAQLDMADPGIAEVVKEIGKNRAQWFAVHEDKQKNELLQTDTDLRARLEILLQGKGELASAELRAFAQAELISTKPAKTDARLLFYESPWRGFDIVIGNPPYEALNKSISSATIKRLADDKHYRTTNVRDLYSLFCETALALAKPMGGVVTLVVPLSVAFGQRQATLRSVFESRCHDINLRHYDNIPDTIFNGAPTLKSWKNSQRTTIVNATRGTANPTLRSTGLQRWGADEREDVLANRTYTIGQKFSAKEDKRISKQWLRAPTKETGELIKAIFEQSQTIGSYEYKGSNGKALAFPETARYFLGAIPANSVSPRRENVFPVEDEDTLCLLMAALNGHVGYGWWWMVGDGFHIKAVADLEILKIPNRWSESPAKAIALGRRLIDAIPECMTQKKNSGTVWKNVNFHLKPDLIEELDHLHIKALGLEVEPLLTHLKIMRSSSNWNYSV